MNVIEFWQGYKFFGLSVEQILTFFSLILLTLVSARVLNLVVIKFIKAQTKKTKTELDDLIVEAVESPIMWLVYILGLYFALLSLNPVNKPIPLKDIISGVTETSVALIFAWLCFKLVDVFDQFLVDHLQQNNKNKETILMHFFPLFKRSLKVAIGFIALIIIVQSRGYSVTSLITGFGITGLAVGFAARESIANIFGSFSVVVDQAYKVGDWIMVDKTISGNNAEGIVEDISLRSTKIRAFDNTLIIIPNNEMANATIKNVSRHKKRRIFEYIDITYNTPPEKVEQAIEICRQVVRNHPEMEEYQQIHLNQLGSHSLKILFYVFTKTTDWGEYLRIRQELFLCIMKEFHKLGVEFAFPTQTLYMNKGVMDIPLSEEYSR
ncbi:MAG: MscS mechanosensitive ion channel [uncultured bacterium]|nr:MAG: MscS mechanosensitive ion channel [uncultured bacterium]